MANYYTTSTTDTCLNCDDEEADKLRALLGVLEYDADGCAEEHGFELEQIGPGSIYLVAKDECSDHDLLPDAFLAALGPVIQRNEIPYLEIGYAHTCDKARPGSHGGGYARIYPNGRLVNPTITWEVPS